MIALADLKLYTEHEVIEHIVNNYLGEDSRSYYGEIYESDIFIARQKLSNKTILIAYESVGDYGCDSTSFFLLKDTVTGKYFEIHGSHCSCYGFGGQLDLEESDIKSLKYRIENAGHIFYSGGYDDNEDDNQKIVNEYIKSL